MRYVYSLSNRKLYPYSGSKAANIHFLLRHQCQVPASWVIIWTAREDNMKDSHATQTAIRKELMEIIDPQKLYAVRSSASVEDSGDFSCAGLFKSYLQVHGIDNIIDYIGKVWESLESFEFETYWENIMSEGTDAHMAVIIQEMVQAEISGVVFNKNPMTGLSETIIEAGKGTGESQVDDRIDPERWISKWGIWTQKPREGLLSLSLAREIVAKANDISSRYRKPVDLEWAWDGRKLYFLQVRPITRLDVPIYSNRIAREMLPGIIKPLVWSVNTSLINPTWVKILTQLTGDHEWKPDNLTGHYYFRTYFNMAIFARVFERLGMPGEALELLFGLEQEGPEKPIMRPGLGILPRTPNLLSFAMSFVGINNRLERLIRDKKTAYEKLSSKVEEENELTELLKLASEILVETRDVAYYNIVVPMLAMMHHRLLSSLLKKQGYDILSIELRGSKEADARYNPQNTLKALHDRYFSDLDQISQITDELPQEQEELLRQDINKFLNVFGHFSDSGNDFSSIPWRETPDLIRRMIARPQQSTKSDFDLQRFEHLKLDWPQRILISTIFRRTGRFCISREAISSFYTYGYGQFRNCFVKIGQLLVERGAIDNREDVYYLYWNELSDIIENKSSDSHKALISSRRQEIELYQDVVLPEMIIGSEQPPVVRGVESSLRGIPTSLGTYSGPARVIRCVRDFEKLQYGDVLIIPFSDVGWTPLFARAGAVVAESGGILSHSSIVAREYRIPAVVSVSGACRLADGIQITVNGYTGDIVLL